MSVRNVGYIPKMRGLYLEHAEFLEAALLVSNETYSMFYDVDCM